MLGIRAVCVDLDGTLVDSEGDAADALERALGALSKADGLKQRPLYPDERAFVVGHGWGEIYRFLHLRGDLPWSYERLEHAVFEARLELLDERGACVLPGAREVVRSLRTRYPLALVTGSTRNEAELMLRTLGITDCFQATFCAGDYPNGKPSPEPYLFAARALNVQPEHCLALEDSTAGIRAALAAKMLCVAIRAGNRYGQDQSAADVIIDKLTDLEPWMAQVAASSG